MPFASVPDGEGKHPPEPFNQALAVLLVQVDEHLGITPGDEGMSLGDQLGPQFPEVVDLTVHHDSNRAVLVENWLVAPLYIDDREALHTNRDPIVTPDATRVRSAMLNRRAHAMYVLRIDAAGEVDLAGYAAHIFSALSVGITLSGNEGALSGPRSALGGHTPHPAPSRRAPCCRLTCAREPVAGPPMSPPAIRAALSAPPRTQMPAQSPTLAVRAGYRRRCRERRPAAGRRS